MIPLMHYNNHGHRITNIFRPWTIGGKVPWAPVLHWAVIYHGITGYTSANGPLAAVICMIQMLVKM